MGVRKSSPETSPGVRSDARQPFDAFHDRRFLELTCYVGAFEVDNEPVKRRLAATTNRFACDE